MVRYGWLAVVGWALGCAGVEVDGTVAETFPTEDSASPEETPAEPGPPSPPWTTAVCSAVPASTRPFAAEVARFLAQPAGAPGGVVAVGSSTIRRWETGARALAPWGLVQRGLGGARLHDLLADWDGLVLRHAPGAVVIFAGTNDLADGVSVAQVLDGVRCAVARTVASLGPVPVLYVGITPTPARWSGWSDAEAVHDGVRSLAAAWPGLRFVDTPSVFLARAAPGEPPPAGLFDPDGLHLSPAGYALWEAEVRAAVAAVLAERPPSDGTGAPPPGTYVRVDLGPTDGVDGQVAPATDAFGNAWNAWAPVGGVAGGAQVLAGEAMVGLRTTAGEVTGAGLLIAGGFRANGLRNGGLTDPPGDRLQTLAVPDATGDFFYVETADDPGALTLTGLDPAARYTLRLFASRASDEEVRVTRYTVFGAGAPAITTLTTTGPDVGAGGRDGNDGDVAVLTGLQPDAWGNLHLDVAREAGRFAYLSLLEVEAER